MSNDSNFQQIALSSHVSNENSFVAQVAPNAEK